MRPALKIFIDRLKGDAVEQIEEELPSDFLEIQEEDLSFAHPIHLKGSAYLASQHLILELTISTSAQIPCIICNEKVEVSIEIRDVHHTIEVASIKSAIYDYSQEVRSSILLKIPTFVECQEGNCPERKTINKYLKTEP